MAASGRKTGRIFSFKVGPLFDQKGGDLDPACPGRDVERRKAAFVHGLEAVGAGSQDSLHAGQVPVLHGVMDFLGSDEWDGDENEK